MGSMINYEQLPYLIAALIPALTFHEWGHARMAKYFGDDTAEREGRLTLNPLAHLDLMGSLMILVVGFGWAKPVPIDVSRMKGSWAEFWVAAAGPLMNIVLAIGFVILAVFISQTGALNSLDATQSAFIIQVIYFSVILNFALCFFNLIPIRPLDGHYILARLLPFEQRHRFMEWNMRYGSMLLFGAILADIFLRIGIFQKLILAPAYFFSNGLLSLA